ncbi:ras-related protein Rab-37 isoform 4-T4 [Glossophaga mutica]
MTGKPGAAAATQDGEVPELSLPCSPSYDLTRKNKVVTVDGVRVKLQIWDTAGQERFRSVTHAYYRDAQALLLLYDITNKSSFDNIRAWLTEIHEYAQRDVVIMLLGNKVSGSTAASAHPKPPLLSLTQHYLGPASLLPESVSWTSFQQRILSSLQFGGHTHLVASAQSHLPSGSFGNGPLQGKLKLLLIRSKAARLFGPY